MKNFLNRIKPGVPKNVLLIVYVLFWGIGSYRVLLLSADKLGGWDHSWPLTLAGLIGYPVFFRLVFYPMAIKHVRRIVLLPEERPCMFSFIDWKGYVIICIMITLAFTIEYLHVVPDPYLGAFFISLGLSLGSATIYYFYASVRFSVFQNRYQNLK